MILFILLYSASIVSFETCFVTVMSVPLNVIHFYLAAIQICVCMCLWVFFTIHYNVTMSNSGFLSIFPSWYTFIFPVSMDLCFSSVLESSIISSLLCGGVISPKTHCKLKIS